MKILTSLALGVIVSLSVAGVTALDAAAQFGRGNEQNRGDDRRGDRVCVYKDINYNGSEQCYSVGDELANLGGNSRSISSIRIYGRASVTVYEDTAFRGHSAQFTSDVPDLGRRIMAGNNSWSDRINALRVTGPGGLSNNNNNNNNNNNFPNVGVFGRQQLPREGICVYDRPNYQGRSECFNAGDQVRDLARQGNWSDKISSIRVFGRTIAVFYRDNDYRGDRLIIEADIPDLAQFRARGRGPGNWNDQVSSVQIQADRGIGRDDRGRR